LPKGALRWLCLQHKATAAEPRNPQERRPGVLAEKIHAADVAAQRIH